MATFGYYSESSGGPFPDSLDLQTILGDDWERFRYSDVSGISSWEGGAGWRSRGTRSRSSWICRGSLERRGSRIRSRWTKIEEQMLDLVDWEKLAPGKGKPNKEQRTKIIEAETQKFMKAQMPKIMAATTQLQRGLLFTTQLSPEADAHYAGKGVSLGAADTPIFSACPEGWEAVPGHRRRSLSP